MLKSAEVVVIGSGALGSSVAYHLAVQGQRDVVLLDRYAIASQTSPRAAGLTQQIRPDPEMTRLAMLSVQKITRFAEETGEPLVYYQGGSIKMARTDADVRQIEAEIAAGQTLGLDIAPITSDDLAELAPWAKADGVLAMWYTPSDLYLEPVQIPAGYARAAERLGTTVLPDTAVTAIRQQSGRITGVTTNRGEIDAPVVIDAAGAWARQVAAQAGIRIPIVPMRHQLFITTSLPGVEAGQAICRVIDANVYVRPDNGGLMLGGYEPNPRLVDMANRPPDYQIADLVLDLGVLRRLAGLVRHQFPIIMEAPIAVHRGGLPTMTADGKHLVGPVPGLTGFYAATGCCVGGLSISPAIGQTLAELIVTGVSSLPLDALALTRFGADLNDDQLQAACVATYAHQYSGGWREARGGSD